LVVRFSPKSACFMRKIVAVASCLGNHDRPAVMQTFPS
jgi:hypothetical protein